MERAEVAQDGSWSSFSAAALVEESEFMAQLLGPCQFSNEQGQHDQSYGLNSMQWSSDHAADSYYCSSDIVNGSSSVYYWSQGDENSNNSLQFAATPGYESYYNLNESSKIPADNACTAAMNYCMVGDQLARQSLRVITNPPVGDPTGMNEDANSDDHGDSSRNVTEAVQPKRKPQMLEDNFPSQSCKKKTRASTNVTKSSSKKAQSKRILKGSGNGEDRENAACAANGGQSSCSYSSEDDSQASQEQNGGGCTSSSSMGTAALNPNGKSRAGRGSATDPQSLYARKRRERINERLKILQNLVPNGTKVDISTMLEEAVQYVKFLQLQIKLLSSDDLWMYAPIAYNGMNIGLDLKISPTQ